MAPYDDDDEAKRRRRMRKEETERRLLEKFPFDEVELRRLLEGYDVYRFLMRDAAGVAGGGGRQQEEEDEAAARDDCGDGEGRRQPQLMLHSMMSFLSDGGGSSGGGGGHSSPLEPSSSPSSAAASSQDDSEPSSHLDGPANHAHDQGLELAAGKGGGGQEGRDVPSSLPILAELSPMPTFDSSPSGEEDVLRLLRRRRQSDLLRSVESSLLPPDLGSALLRELISTAFVVESPSQYRDLDEAERESLRETEQYLEGMANACGRRGPRQALQLIFGCCCEMRRRKREGGEGEGKKKKKGGRREADAQELVGLCYRLALAGHALRVGLGSAHSDNRDIDIDALVGKLASRCGVTPASMSSSLLHHTAEAMGLPSPESYEGGVPLRCFVDWADATVPHLHSVLGTFVRLLLFPDSESSRTMATFEFPAMTVAGKAEEQGRSRSAILGRDDDDDDGGIDTGAAAFGMAAMAPSLCGKWHRLYTTEADGASFLSLRRAVAGYSGPTLLLIRPTSTDLLSEESRSRPSAFGYYTSSTWRESGSKYCGSDDCFLFRADPTLRVYRPSFGGATGSMGGMGEAGGGCDENYLRLHSRTACARPTQRGSPAGFGGGPGYGLGCGGTENRPRLFVTESLEGCHANSGMLDRTYEQGPLLPGEWDTHFDVDVLEVWGVGVDSDGLRCALDSRTRHRTLEDSNWRKNGTVDRRQFLEDFQNGTVLNSLYEHRELARGRRNFSIDEKHPGGYVLEGK